MIWRPSGVQASVNGRACPSGSSVPTRTRAASAPRAPVRARSTSMIEMLLPSKSACALSRAVTAMNLPFGLALMPKGPVCTGMRGATSTTGTPISACRRSITDTSLVPAFPEKRYAFPSLPWPRARVPRHAQRHLDLSSAAAGPALDDADAVRAVLGEPVFRVAHEQQLRKDQQTDCPEVAAVVVPLYGAIGIVEFRPEHRPYVH